MCKFSGTHERVCPKRIFQENSEATGLRFVILQVLGYLRKGKNVVVDDDNSSEMTRKSYVTQIKRKFPQCCFRCVVFKPRCKDNYLQYLWSQEWYKAQHFLYPELGLTSGLGAEKSELDVKEWFEQSDSPSQSENMTVTELQLNLLCDTKYMFELPGLFIEYGGMVQDQDASCVTWENGLKEVLEKWNSKNPHGRVIFIHSGKHTCEGGNLPDVRHNDKSCGCLQQLKNTLCHLSEKVNTPFYFVYIKDVALSGSFGHFPNPGLLAWLQRVHCIDLAHRATLYVYHTDGHCKAASTAGVKCVKAKKMLERPRMINAIHCGGSTVKMPVVVRNAVLASFDSSPVSPNAAIPLFRDAMDSSQQLGNCQCVTVSRGFGRIHGLCYQNLSALERYQASYQSVATITQPASCFSLDTVKQNCERKDDSKRALLETENAEVVQSRSCTSTVTDGVGVGKQSFTTTAVNNTEVKVLEFDDIRSQAFSTTRFDRGLVCVRSVYELQTAIARDGLWIESKCTGSQGGQYNVSALIDGQGIREAKCTCQDQPAASLGRCKHAVGMLLKFQENQEQLKHGTTELEKLKRNSADRNPMSQNVPSLETNNQSKTATRDDIEESRLPPKRVVGASQNASLEEERKRKEATNFVFGKKRMKRQTKIENTIYCMTEEELLDTARMILQQETCLSIESSSKTAADEEKKSESFSGKAINTKPSQLQSQSYTKQRLYQEEKGEKETTTTEDTKSVANTVTNSPECQVFVPAGTVSFVPETSVMTGSSLHGDHSAQEVKRDSCQGSLTGNVNDNEKKLRMKFGKSILDDLI